MNRILGRIAQVESSEGISLVEIEAGEGEAAGTRLSALVLDTAATAPFLEQGRAVSVFFKESEVSLAAGSVEGISIRNRLRCRITAVEKGVLLSVYRLAFGGHRLSALITTRSGEALGLAVGMPVTALIKSTEVSLGEEGLPGD